MDNVFLVNSASFDTLVITQSITVVQGATVDLSNANYVSGTFQGTGTGLTGVTASYINVSVTASTSDSASYLSPGATFYLVSGSDGIPPAYIEPYDYCTTESLYRPPFKEGRLVWDHKYIDYAHYMDTDWRIHLGKEVTIGVHNPTEATMSRLSPVYISGSSAGEFRPDVYLAVADGTNTKSKVVGIVRSDIPPNSNGWVLMRGEMHRTNVSAYGVVGTRLWLDPTTPGAITATKPGQPNEIVAVGYVSEAGTLGSFICDIVTEPPPANAYAGMTSVPSIVDDSGSFQVYVGSGSVNLYNDPNGVGAITQYSLLPVTFSVPASLTASFIYATTDGTTASYALTNDYTIVNGTSKVLLATLYRADEDTHWIEGDKEGLALANKLNNRFIATERFVRESGFSLLVTGSNYFVITEGSAWFGASKITQQEFDSRNTGSVNPMYETHWVYHSASTWLIPTQSNGKWNNFYYDDGTNRLSLAPDSWSVNYLYRILGENPFDEDVFMVFSNYQYADLASARADLIPTNVPAVLNDVALMVGRIIFQSGSETGTVESSFVSEFGSSTVSQHNSLAGIQGGQGGEYYHLTATEYTTLGDSASYAISASYSVSSSYAPVESTYSASVVTQLSNKQNNISTGSILPVTASEAILAQTASVATSSSYAVSASYAPYIATGLATGSTYPITSSWAQSASVAISASYAPSVTFGLETGSTYPITASQAVSSSWALSSSWAPGGNGTSLETGSTYPFTSSWAESSSYAVSASYAPGSTFGLETGSTYPITASQAVSSSWALSSSWAPGGNGTSLETGSTYPFTSSWAESSSYAVSASYAPGSVFGLETGSTYPITASEAVSSSWALSASWAPGGNAQWLETGSSYPITASQAVTASYANLALTASYATNITSQSFFTRGGVFYDAGGFAGNLVVSQSAIIWRAPFAGVVSNIWGYRVTGSSATVNARKNGSGSLATGSNIVLTNSDVWISASALVPASTSFVAGDKFEIIMFTSSGYPTQVAIQLDMYRT